jgi:hypothetical protein
VKLRAGVAPSRPPHRDALRVKIFNIPLAAASCAMRMHGGRRRCSTPDYASSISVHEHHSAARSCAPRAQVRHIRRRGQTDLAGNIYFLSALMFRAQAASRLRFAPGGLSRALHATRLRRPAKRYRRESRRRATR